MITCPLYPDIGACVLSAYDADQFLTLGIDGDAATTKLPPVEAIHPLGFIARPLDPETDSDGNINQGQACTLLRLAGENEDMAMALGDPRVTPTLPALPKGSAMLYGPTGSDDLPRILCSGVDDSITIHVGSATKVTIEVAGGPSITVDNGAVQLGAPGGAPLVKDDGGIAAAWSQIQSLFASLGRTFTPPTGYTCTKAKGT